MSCVPKVVVYQTTGPFSLIEIELGAWKTLGLYRQRTHNATEGGGVILGARRGPHYQVLAVTEPQKSDKRGLYFFVRNGRAHLRLARQAWLESGRANGYLGEWHSHAEAWPTPSRTDAAGWRKLAKRLGEPLVHVIVGTQDIAVWLCEPCGVLTPARRL